MVAKTQRSRSLSAQSRFVYANRNLLVLQLLKVTLTSRFESLLNQVAATGTSTRLSSRKNRTTMTCVLPLTSIFTEDGVRLFVDSISLALIRGSTIDYVTELIGSQFAIRDNPQAKGSGCGCGVSWEPND